MINTLINIITQIINVLAIIGAAAKELAILLPFVLIAVLWVLIGNYREEITFRRLSYSRIREIDELSPQKYYLFLKAFLGYKGFSEEMHVEESEDKGESGEYIQYNQPDSGKNGGKKAGIGEPLILIKEGIRYGVLLERKKLGLGLLAFNKLEKAMGEHDCPEGIILNNGFFSEMDLTEGEARNILMWDRKWLIKALLEMQGFEDTEGKDFKYYFHDFWKWALRN